MDVAVIDEATLRRLVREEVERVMKPVVDALAAGGAVGVPGGGDVVFMTQEEVAALLRVDRRTLRRLELAGDIPRSITIGERAKRWRRTTIERWLRSMEQRP